MNTSIYDNMCHTLVTVFMCYIYESCMSLVKPSPTICCDQDVKTRQRHASEKIRSKEGCGWDRQNTGHHALWAQAEGISRTYPCWADPLTRSSSVEKWVNIGQACQYYRHVLLLYDGALIFSVWYESGSVLRCRRSCQRELKDDDGSVKSCRTR